jgi:hypothetical protein
MNKLKNIFLFILFPLLGLGGFGFSGFAQVFPVQMTPVFSSPYSSKISDYATSLDTKFQLIVNPTDISINNRQVRLKIYIQGNGITAQSSDFVTGLNPIYINGGDLITLTNVDLGALFRLENLQGLSAVQYANPLPEGIYSFCFEMYDFVTNQRISQKSCASIYLMLNDPPLLNLPARNEQIVVSDFPNILFSWTPRQLNATNVSYRFELKEIQDPSIDPQFGFAMSPLLYEEELFSTAMVYDAGKPNLIAGKRYAWRVRAISTGGLSENAVFKNEGYSEVFWFTYASNCAVPTFVLSEVLSAKSVKITWQGTIDNTKYHVQYKKKNVAGAEWFSVYTLNQQTTISDLEAGVDYDFRVGATCEPASSATAYIYSGINSFVMPAEGATTTAYSCGIYPAVAIANQTPITNLIVSETFTAGDFPVKVLQLEDNRNPYTGKGYIIVPYLADTKIAVEFTNVTINTSYQLINGVVETTYDPDWKNVMTVDPIIEEIFGPQTGTETIDTIDPDATIDVTTTSGTDGTTSTGTNTTDTTTTTNTTTTGTSTTGTDTSSNNNTANTDNTTSTSNPSSTGTNVTGNDYYIEYKGQKYYTGGKIKIPYKRSMFETFEMKTLASDARVGYTIHEPGKQEMWRGYDGYSSKTTIPIEENNASLVNLKILDLQSEATSIDGKPKVRIEIEKVVKPFVESGLTVKQKSKPSRVAKADETLYFVDKPGPTKQQYEIVYEAITSPATDVSLIPKENLKWSSAGKDLVLYLGQKTVPDDSQSALYAWEGKNVEMTSIAGYPILKDKSVDIKWINEDRTDASFMPPAVSATISNFSNNILVPFKKMADGLNEMLGAKLEAKIKPIKIKGEKYNEIDEKSRHYLKVLKGSINGGVSIKYSDDDEPVFYPPFLKILNIAGISEVGLYLAPKIEFNLVGGRITNTIGETNKVLKDQFFVEGNVKGCLEVGLKAKLLVATELVDFSVKGYGEGCMSGKVNYNLSIDEFVGGIYLDPLKLGVKAKIKSKDEYFKFTLVDIDKTWTITDKFLIYEYKN